MAASYNNAGDFYADQNNPKKAEDLYLKAIDIREKLAADYPEKFNPDLVESYLGYAIFKNDNTLFLKALDLAKKCPDNARCRKIIELLS